MDLENQQRVKDAAEKYGAENVVVILGSSDPEGAEIYAETVTLGDPTFAGPLAGVPLGLCVCHVLEPEIKAEADAAKWDEQIGMMEMVLNVDALADAVAQNARSQQQVSAVRHTVSRKDKHSVQRSLLCGVFVLEQTNFAIREMDWRGDGELSGEEETSTRFSSPRLQRFSYLSNPCSQPFLDHCKVDLPYRSSRHLLQR